MDEKKKKDKQHSFDYYCKKVLRNCARDHYNSQKRAKKKETLFSDLSLVEQNQLYAMDEYFTDAWMFDLLGAKVSVNDEALACALSKLTEFRRDIVLLYYFLTLSDQTIAEILACKRAKVQYHRVRALLQLRDWLLAEGGAD